MDIFDEKGIKPMLIAEMQEAFDSPDYIYELNQTEWNMNFASTSK